MSKRFTWCAVLVVVWILAAWPARAGDPEALERDSATSECNQEINFTGTTLQRNGTSFGNAATKDVGTGSGAVA